MTFTTNIFVEPESPPTSYSILRCREEEIESHTFVETSSSTESFNTTDCEDSESDQQLFVTYQTLNDCQEQQESLIDVAIATDSDAGSESDDSSMLRENSDDSLFQMLSTVGFSIKNQKKRVTFKPMVKVIHFESAELAEKYALQEAERQRLAKIAEESKSFVSGVKFFVGNNFDNDDYDSDY